MRSEAATLRLASALTASSHQSCHGSSRGLLETPKQLAPPALRRLELVEGVDVEARDAARGLAELHGPRSPRPTPTAAYRRRRHECRWFTTVLTHGAAYPNLPSVPFLRRADVAGLRPPVLRLQSWRLAEAGQPVSSPAATQRSSATGRRAQKVTAVRSGATDSLKGGCRNGLL